MSEMSDFYEALDERAMEGECGAISPTGERCAKPFEHHGPHRTHRWDKVQKVWRRTVAEREATA